MFFSPFEPWTCIGKKSLQKTHSELIDIREATEIIPLNWDHTLIFW